MKRCRVCKHELPETEFHRTNRTSDGLKTDCKGCRSEENRARRLANHDLHIARGKVNRERNRVNDLKSKAAWRENNREYQNQLVREWAEKNPEKRRQSVRFYRERKRQAGGTFGKYDLEEMLIAQSGRCNICRDLLVRYEVDHMTPVSRGGSNSAENRQLLCPSCNKRKADKTMEELSCEV